MENYFTNKLNFNVVNRDNWVKSQINLLEKGQKVLDVGAGSAPYRVLFKNFEYYTQDAMPLKNEQLRDGKYSQIDYISDITKMPINDNTFDCVLCTEVLEHVPYPIESIKEMSRILKSGGRILLTVPLGSGLHQEPYHFYGGYTKYFFLKFLAENNFNEITIEANLGFFSFFSQEFRRFATRLKPKLNAFIFITIPIYIFFKTLALIIALIAPWLDNLYMENDFTVGYHVSAIKK